VLKIFI